MYGELAWGKRKRGKEVSCGIMRLSWLIFSEKRKNTLLQIATFLSPNRVSLFPASSFFFSRSFEILGQPVLRSRFFQFHSTGWYSLKTRSCWWIVIQARVYTRIHLAFITSWTRRGKLACEVFKRAVVHETSVVQFFFPSSLNSSFVSR